MSKSISQISTIGSNFVTQENTGQGPIINIRSKIREVTVDNFAILLVNPDSFLNGMFSIFKFHKFEIIDVVGECNANL